MMNNERLDQYYITRWSDRKSFRPYKSPAKTRRLSAIAQYLEEYGPRLSKTENVRVLDYGCGSGWLLPFLRFYGFDPIVAYDVTPQVLQVVAEKYAWAQVVSGNSNFPSPLPDSSFELVTSIEVLEHVPHKNQRDYFADLYRIASPGGLVIITTPNVLWRSYLLPQKEQPIEDWVSIVKFRQLAHATGFTVLDLRTRGIINYPSPGNRMFLNTRLKKTLTLLGAWRHYCNLLERLGRGITIHALLQRPDS